MPKSRLGRRRAPVAARALVDASVATVVQYSVPAIAAFAISASRYRLAVVAKGLAVMQAVAVMMLLRRGHQSMPAQEAV